MGGAVAAVVADAVWLAVTNDDVAATGDAVVAFGMTTTKKKHDGVAAVAPTGAAVAAADCDEEQQAHDDYRLNHDYASFPPGFHSVPSLYYPERRKHY